MASGEVHDRTTWMGAAGLGLVIWTVTNSFEQTTGASAGVLFGGLMLSPDLDIKSKPWRRWGLLRFLWTPYQKVVPHRSVLSHSPLIGTAGRLIYLAIPTLLICLIFRVPIDLVMVKQVLFQGGFMFLGGIEVGCCLHLLMDWLG